MLHAYLTAAFVSALLVLLSLRSRPLRRAIHVIAGFTGYGLGRHGRITLYLFRPWRPKFLEFETTQEFQEHFPDYRYSYLSDLIDGFDTGDIMLMSSTRASGIGIGVRWANICPFTHVGMIYRDRDGELFLYEACGLNKSVVMTPLVERLNNPAYRVAAYRKMSPPNDPGRIVEQHMEEHLGKEHDAFSNLRGVKELFWASLDFRVPFTDRELFDNRDRTVGFFCSELVADVLMEMGLLPDDVGTAYPDANEYTPADFSTIRDPITENREQKLVDAVDHLEPEIFILKTPDGFLATRQ